MRHSTLLRIASLIALPVLSACEGILEPDDVVGTYSATTFTVTQQGTTTNLLATGATFSITLAADGSTTGQLFIPDAAEGGGDFTASMAGTFTMTGDNVVEFTQDADSFVRDMEFVAVKKKTLTGSENFSGDMVNVVLTRQ